MILYIIIDIILLIYLQSLYNILSIITYDFDINDYVLIL